MTPYFIAGKNVRHQGYIQSEHVLKKGDRENRRLKTE